MSGEIMSLEMDVFCLLLLIRILYQMYINREQNDHRNYFYHTIAWACVYLFMDAIWIMNVKHLLTFNKIQSGIFNSFYFCSLAMLVCSWYIYAQKTFHSTVFEHKKCLVLTFIPLIFFIGSSLVSYWTHGLFVIDQAGNYHRGKLLPFYFLILFAYILYLSIKAGYLSKKAKNYLYQKEYKAIARFSFLPLTRLLQPLFPGFRSPHSLFRIIHRLLRFPMRPHSLFPLPFLPFSLYLLSEFLHSLLFPVLTLHITSYFFLNISSNWFIIV
mgnify:CR=1 FL=1